MRASTETTRHEAMLREIVSAPALVDRCAREPDRLALALLGIIIVASAIIATLLFCPGVVDAAGAYLGGR